MRSSCSRSPAQLGLRFRQLLGLGVSWRPRSTLSLTLQGRRGRVKQLRGREVRQAIYQQVREVLVTANEDRIPQLSQSLQQLAHTSDCPKRLQMDTLEFLR